MVVVLAFCSLFFQYYSIYLIHFYNEKGGNFGTVHFGLIWIVWNIKAIMNRKQLEIDLVFNSGFTHWRHLINVNWMEVLTIFFPLGQNPRILLGQNPRILLQCIRSFYHHLNLYRPTEWGKKTCSLFQLHTLQLEGTLLPWAKVILISQSQITWKILYFKHISFHNVIFFSCTKGALIAFLNTRILFLT